MMPTFSRHGTVFRSVLAAAAFVSTGGCTEEVQSLPLEQAAPSSTLVLTETGEAAAGRTWGYDIVGLTPGSAVRLVAARGGAGAGDCPADLGGNCYDMLPGRFGYRNIRTGTADGSGRFTGELVFPSGVRPGDYQLQAVSPDGAASNESNVITLTVADDCRTDAAEPNDTQASAAPLDAAGRAGDVVCSSDFDWYTTTVPPGAYVEITVSHELTDGDLDMVLFNEDGFDIDASRRATEDEVVTWYNGGAAPADVSLWIYAFADFDDNGVGYDIEVEVVEAGVCAADAYEPDDTVGMASVVGVGTWDARSCDGDSDWWAIDLAAGEVLQVEVLEDVAAGDVDLNIYDGALQLQNISAEDSLPWFSEVDQQVYVEVVLSSDSAFNDGNDYSLDVAVGTATACSDDAAGEDDSFLEARVIGAGTWSARSCFGDMDWYQIDLAAGDSLEAEIDEVFQDGNVELQVFFEDGTELTSGPTDGVDYTAFVDETLYLRTELTTDPAPGDGNDYDLVVDISQQVVCPADFAEPNNIRSEAVLLAYGTYNGLGGCESSDSDWYAVDVTGGDSVDVELFFSNNDADIDVQITDDQGNRIDLSQSTSNMEFVTATASADTTFYIEVYVYADQGPPTLDGAPYNMVLTKR